ncbi:MAG TPA: hypothetical protein VIK66_10360 [Gaiellaceae bacterium]|jgi:hypothetical protein
MRSTGLHDTLRRFCLGAFAAWHGTELPFAFEEHGTYGRPTLYEYRPLVRGFIEAHAGALRERDDVRQALEELRREPASRIYEDVYRSVLVPLLVRTAEGCGGFDWDDAAFERAYEELEESLYGDGHSYGAVAPLIGVSIGANEIDLGDGLRVRHAVAGELSAMWPESAGLLPRDFGREPDRLCLLELARPVELEVPDAPGELADAVTSMRLAMDAPVAAGPVLFERLDWRPYGIQPVLPIAATAPPGEPTRLDPFRASVAAKVRPLLGLADEDASLGDALDRWELSLFQGEPFRGEQLRHALDAALGNGEGLYAASMRAAALLGETAEERAQLASRFREPTADLVRRTLVSVLLHGDRRVLLRELDSALLGLRAGRERVAELRAS